MTKESWYDVTACLLVGMPSWKIREPWLLNLSEKEALRVGLKELSGLPFHISDAGGINIDKLIWNASRALRQHQIQLLVVDYAQIINANGKDERQKVTQVATKLRVFAKDNNVATILLSQSPRPEGRSINSRPNMFSLKESGTLEEAAHCVILPFRPVDPDTNSFTGEDELVIGKSRWGPIGSIPCRLDGKYLKFEERVV
jgi:replicative DNA helicase